MKTVMTVTGIRPDFIRMREVFRHLDESPHITHILVHTGQHYDKMLSDVFFDELNIRPPDFNLDCGAPGKLHYQLSGDITVALLDLIYEKDLNPDLILFLGDTNSTVCSVELKKAGFRLGHIEAGMRSGDRRMLEEINRTVCDHCCDLHFVYHEDYKRNLLREGIPETGIHVVGNTVVEPVLLFARNLWERPKLHDRIIMDIHRPENFKDPQRLRRIVEYANEYSHYFNLPVHMVSFGRTMQKLEEFGIPLGRVIPVDQMSYKQFLEAQYHSLFVLSDSGTAQEEAALLNTLAVVPRDFTERPQSMDANCSVMVSMEWNSFPAKRYGWGVSWSESIKFIQKHRDGNLKIDPSWLGDGTTSEKIVSILEREL